MRAACRHGPASVSTFISGGHLCSRLLKSDVVGSMSLERPAVRRVASATWTFEATGGPGGGSARQLSCTHKELSPVLSGGGHLTSSCCPPQPGWVGAVAPVVPVPGPMALEISARGASSLRPPTVAWRLGWRPNAAASAQIHVGESYISSPFGCCLTVKLAWGCLSC